MCVTSWSLPHSRILSRVSQLSVYFCDDNDMPPSTMRAVVLKGDFEVRWMRWGPLRFPSLPRTVVAKAVC